MNIREYVEKHPEFKAVLKNRPMTLRGEPLFKDASTIINGERQDMYGAPEDSFKGIGDLWSMYLQNRKEGGSAWITPADVAFLMVLYKIAREMNQHKRDNIVDMVGYLGIYDDLNSS